MVCKYLIGAFVLAYAAALILLAIGTFGLFGQERDPLSGVFLMPLGMPWTFLTGSLPALLLPLAGILAPALNLGLLLAICRATR